MSNLISYAREELDTFESRSFCSVDSLALSYLAYVELPEEMGAARTHEGMRVAELYRAEYFDSYFPGLSNPESRVEMLSAVCASPRFRDVRICDYRKEFSEEAEMQFCAMTFLLPGNTVYIAYKGTDSSFVGWKEDFNLLFQCPVPSQTAAAKYLNEVAQKHEGTLYVGGHSKGGNLAVYAAAMCNQPIKDRITKVFSHDGPGFMDAFITSAMYQSVSERIEKTVPQLSIVGMLMEEGEYEVVESHARGFMQHDPSTWSVVNCDFVRLDKLNDMALKADEGIEKWLSDLDLEEREEFVESLYYIIEETGAEAIEDVTGDWRKAVRSAGKALRGMDPDKKSHMTQAIGDLLAAVRKAN